MPKVNAYVFRFKAEKEDKLKDTIITNLNDDNLLKDDEEIDFSDTFDEVS